jgi:RNA polymerase sigma-70 factor, ECF subfamily
VSESVAAAPAGLEELYARYSASVFRVCLRYTRSEEDAEDLVHETFMKVQAHLGDFQGRSSVYTWIYRVAVNECLAWMRGRNRRGKAVELIEALEPEAGEEAEALDARLLAEKLIGWTDAKTREILFMAYLEGLKQEEIARVLNISRRAVSKRLTVFREKVARMRKEASP